MADDHEQPRTVRRVVGPILRSVVLNAVIPLGLYYLAKSYVSDSEVLALGVAALFPIIESVLDLAGKKTVDPVAVIVLGGVVVSIVSVVMGGSVKLLLIRESLFTGALGIACFGSLLLRRPLMFYFGRFFLAGKDPQKSAAFESRWERPRFRFVSRLITVVWGAAFSMEFSIRVLMVYTLSTSTVLAASPVVLSGITIATVVWTFAFIRRERATTRAAYRSNTDVSAPEK
jgi:hypothetical protein